MQGRPITIDWQETAENLYEKYQTEKDLKKRQRLQFLWLVRSGHSVKTSSHVAGLGERSGQRCLSWYRQGGVAEVLSHKHGGHAQQQRFLNEEQESELIERSESGQLKTVWAAVNWSKETHNVAYSYEGMRSVFKRLGLRKKVPRPQHEKSDQSAQSAWKKGGL